SASITGSANGIYKPTSTNSRFGSTGASTRSTPSVRCSASLATQRRRPMPSFIPATGITLHLEGECVNRIGVDNTKYVSSPHGNVLVQSAAKRECRSQEVVAAEFFQIGQVLNKLGNLDRQSAISAELFIDAASVLFLSSDKEWREYSMFWQSNQLSWSRVENIDLSKFSFKTNSCEIAGPDDLGTIVWGTLLRSNPRTGTDVSGYVDVMPSSSSGGESKRQTRWSYCNGLNPQNFDPKIIKKYAFCNWRRFEVFI